MNLQLLKETPNVAIYYDSANDWLFVDWYGYLTLPLVQANCLAVAECLVERAYPRILNSNQNVTSFALSVPFWLGTEYLPHLGLSGIEYLAWVYTPNLLLKPLIDKLVAKLEAPIINLFDDVESAATWLQHTRFHHLSDDSLNPVAKHAKLVYQVEALSETLTQAQAAPETGTAVPQLHLA